MTSKLNTGIGIATVLASIQALLDSQVGCAELILPPCQGSTGCALRVAPEELVVGNGAIVHIGEGRVLVDRDDIISATNLALVSCARVRAVRLRQLDAVDGSPAEAFAVVFQASILVVVACTCQNCDGSYRWGKYLCRKQHKSPQSCSEWGDQSYKANLLGCSGPRNTQHRRMAGRGKCKLAEEAPHCAGQEDQQLRR